jgi:tetratricopeptide (TPR) repeat protein
MRRGLILAGVVLLAAAGAAAGYVWSQNRPQAVFEQGLAALSRGDVNGVRLAADRLQGRRGFEAERALLRGAVLLRTEQYRAALDELGAAQARPALRGQALALIGEALYRMNEFPAAIHQLQQAVELRPNDPDVHRWLAAACYDLGLNGAAIDELQRVAELSPDDARPLRMTGLIYKDNEQFKQAAEAYAKSLAIDPQPAEADEIYLEYAQCLNQLHRSQDALAALAHCQESARKLALQADCEYREANVEQANALLARALQLDPKNFDALLLQGTIASEQGRPDDAKKSLDAAVASDPADFTARFRFAQVLQQLGETEKADAQMELKNRYTDLRRRFAELHQEASTKPDDASIRRELAETAKLLHKPELAKMWMRAAAALEHAQARSPIAP